MCVDEASVSWERALPFKLITSKLSQVLGGVGRLHSTCTFLTFNGDDCLISRKYLYNENKRTSYDKRSRETDTIHSIAIVTAGLFSGKH